MDNDGINTQAAASFPVIPGKLAVRVAGVYDESDLDEIENIVTGEVSHEESTAGRLSVSWLPADSLTVDFTAQYLERENDDVYALAGTPTGDPRLDPEAVLKELGEFDRRGALVGLDDTEDNTDADFLNTSLVVNWELDAHTITWVSGYHETDSVRNYDQSMGNANPENVRRVLTTDDRTDWSQELRLSSDEGEFWEYTVGLYYENADIFFSQENYQIPISPLAPGSNVVVFPAEAERLGLFTHNQFYLNDDWTLQVGVRYQEYDADRDISTVAGDNGFAFAGPGDLLVQVLSDEQQSYEDDAVTGQITLQYQLNTDVNLYGLVATGWRPGGVTVSGKVLPEEVLLFEPEDSTSYEVGFKSTLMDGAVRLNGSLYFQDYEDYIARVNAINVREPSGDIGTSGITTNGDAEVYGAELDVTALLSQNWFIGGTLSYSDGEYADGTELPCNEFDDGGAPVIPDGEVVALCDEGGEPIGSAADWTASINSEYSVPFDRFEGYGRILYTYTGDRFSPQNLDVDPYHIFNLYVGIREEQWNIEVFATNLFDEEALRGAGGTEATQLVRRLPTGYGLRFPVPGRRIGLTASYNW